MKPILNAIEKLETLGMKRCGSFLGSYVLQLSADDQSEYLRFFSPQFISKDGGKALVGLLGCMKKEIIRDWGNFTRIADYFIVSAFSANFPDLRDPPVFGIHRERDTEWCSLIVEVLQCFPANQQELDYLKSEKALIRGFEVAKMM